MNNIKTIITGIDIHVNAKSLTITYGSNQITIRVTEDNKIKFDTDLTIGGSDTKYIGQNDNIE